ncbi:GNAT family N-acetyltransferase [Amycolatopsis alkalitolerans]|uniref:GNAT family N-acetyltransferase n=1 Tax=Amycolatopsis alkalitolerans TaxID=2547244 RepID=A0A5C4LS74_9PSEU|nr:GNAT family N-acetyltransferase [Amycolatopsis alkalitolerans]TNC19231.1 GNAT family N-acetyltransferase [Amycolatopsis alkalitolerans]
MDKIEVRRADPADAAELTRLRVVMFEGMGRDPGRFDDAWRRRNTEHFAARLADRTRFAAFVVDAGGAGLAACAIGWLNEHLVGAVHPSSQVGYVANVATDRAHRRRGCARATMEALLAWLRRAGVAKIDLHASPDAEPLYRSLGFTEPAGRALTWLA